MPNNQITLKASYHFSDFDRRAIAYALGGDGKRPATKGEAEQWLKVVVERALHKAVEDFPSPFQA